MSTSPAANCSRPTGADVGVLSRNTEIGAEHIRAVHARVDSQASADPDPYSARLASVVGQKSTLGATLNSALAELAKSRSPEFSTTTSLHDVSIVQSNVFGFDAPSSCFPVCTRIC